MRKDRTSEKPQVVAAGSRRVILSSGTSLRIITVFMAALHFCIGLASCSMRPFYNACSQDVADRTGAWYQWFISDLYE